MAGFPNSPSINDTYTLGNKTWVWDGDSWNSTFTGFTGSAGGLVISSSTGFTGNFLYGAGLTAYTNSYFSSDSDGIPLIQNYGEKAFDNGTADSSGGETFSINLSNGLIHYADMSTGATSYTYSFSITGYSSENTSFALILRGGKDLTINWTDISWDSDGAPDFSSATAGVYSVIPFYRITTPSLGWLGGSSSIYNA